MKKSLTIDIKLIQMCVCNFLLYLKKNRSSSAISVHVAAINKFFAMNDLSIQTPILMTYFWMPRSFSAFRLIQTLLHIRRSRSFVFE